MAFPSAQGCSLEIICDTLTSIKGVLGWWALYAIAHLHIKQQAHPAAPGSSWSSVLTEIGHSQEWAFVAGRPCFRVLVSSSVFKHSRDDYPFRYLQSSCFFFRHILVIYVGLIAPIALILNVMFWIKFHNQKEVEGWASPSVSIQSFVPRYKAIYDVQHAVLKGPEMQEEADQRGACLLQQWLQAGKADKGV